MYVNMHACKHEEILLQSYGITYQSANDLHERVVHHPLGQDEYGGLAARSHVVGAVVHQAAGVPAYHAVGNEVQQDGEQPRGVVHDAYDARLAVFLTEEHLARTQGEGGRAGHEYERRHVLHDVVCNAFGYDVQNSHTQNVCPYGCRHAAEELQAVPNCSLLGLVSRRMAVERPVIEELTDCHAHEY
jgi:hypothetical protein